MATLRTYATQIIDALSRPFDDLDIRIFENLPVYIQKYALRGIILFCKDFIYLSIGKDIKTYGIDYVIIGQVMSILIPPPSGSDVIIKRLTSTKPLVSWQDASVLLADDLTYFQVQLLHLAEEETDRALVISDIQQGQLERAIKAPSGFNGELPDPLVAGEYLRVNEEGTAIETIPIIGGLKGSKSIDGGNASSVYIDSQRYDGGGA